MPNLGIVSSDNGNIRRWGDALGSLYPVFCFDSVDSLLLNADKNDTLALLIIDARLVKEVNCIPNLCHQFCKIIVFGDELLDSEKIQFIYDGACGYSDILIDETMIVRAVESVIKNEIWLERNLIPEMLRGAMKKRSKALDNEMLNKEILKMAPCLTLRESVVVELIYSGEDNESIAKKLDITPRTVKAHLSAVYHKFELSNRFQLIVFLKNLHVKYLSEN